MPTLSNGLVFEKDHEIGFLADNGFPFRTDGSEGGYIRVDSDLKDAYTWFTITDATVQPGINGAPEMIWLILKHKATGKYVTRVAEDNNMNNSYLAAIKDAPDFFCTIKVSPILGDEDGHVYLQSESNFFYRRVLTDHLHIMPCRTEPEDPYTKFSVFVPAPNEWTGFSVVGYNQNLDVVLTVGPGTHLDITNRREGIFNMSWKVDVLNVPIGLQATVYKSVDASGEGKVIMHGDSDLGDYRNQTNSIVVTAL